MSTTPPTQQRFRTVVAIDHTVPVDSGVFRCDRRTRIASAFEKSPRRHRDHGTATGEAAVETAGWPGRRGR